MNETENKNETTTEQTTETTTETVPEKELSPEEKLAEREKAFELKSLKSTAEKSLKSKGIPTEFSDFLNYESEETMNTGIEKLDKILQNFEKPNSTGMTAEVGFKHGRPTGGGNDSFLNGFKN